MTGKVHTKFNLIYLLVYVIPLTFFYRSIEAILLISGILFSTLFMSPDNDLFQASPCQRWKLFRNIWKHYQEIVPHRGISHNIFFGTLSRIYYLLLMSISVIDQQGKRYIALPKYQLYIDPFITQKIKLYILFMITVVVYIILYCNNLVSQLELYFIGGLYAGDWLHISLDYLSDFRTIQRGEIRETRKEIENIWS